MADKEYFQSAYTGAQIDNAIGRIVNGELDTLEETLNTAIALKGDNLEFDTDECKLYLTSFGERVGDGVTVETSGGVGQNVEGTEYTVDEETVTAGTGAEIFNDYANNIASGAYSHAEGNYTKASGEHSHAEGYQTTASGGESHAEGTTTVASGWMSHSEGGATIADGMVSHAEGFGTIANGVYQHTQGKFNVGDADCVYAHIVGNGSATDDRSNAHTLDWKGNAWFAGDVYVGSTSGTNKDDGSVKLVKTSDLATETWTFTLEDGSTVTKAVYVG